MSDAPQHGEEKPPDATAREWTEGMLRVQQQVLERISTDASLEEVLDTLARAIEGQSPEMLCSVLLLDEGRGTLRHGAGPSLPGEYRRAIDGAAIGPRAGSCGTAAYLGRQVIVEDIAADPLWADYRNLALPHGLRACWSTPIRSSAGKVLGTFAMYYRRSRRPDAHDLQLIEVSTNLAAIAIERKRAEAALRESEARFQAFMDHSPAVAWMKDEQLRLVYVNRPWEQNFHRTLDQVRGLTDLDVRPAEVGERLRQHDREVLASGQAKEFEEMVPDPDGRPRHWQVYKFPFQDARGRRFVGGMAVDISERKEAEHKLRQFADRLQVLSRRVLEAQEAERRHLARELHDEIGQILTGISLNLQALKRGAGNAALPWLAECLGAVTEAIQQTRNLSLDLRPSMLDDFGLEEALRWYTERQAQRAGLAIHLDTNLAGGRLPRHLETALFRVAQEALTNVVRHAQARQVWITLKKQGPEVILTVRDDGVGFDPEVVRRLSRQGDGFGLLGMQDRVRLAGGQFAVDARPGAGTTIRVQVPVTATPTSGEQPGGQ